MVIEKGKSYGDSIGSPVRIFSKAGAKDGLQVRIDDKLSRIAKGSEFQGDDTLKDLVGYLALLATDRADAKDEIATMESIKLQSLHGPGCRCQTCDFYRQQVSLAGPQGLGAGCRVK